MLAAMLASLKTLGVTLFYQPLFNLLFGFVAILPGENLGLAIIALTILVRLLLLPSSAAATKSQRELMALQPKIDEIRSTYKDQPEEMNQRLVAVYQEHKVNPFGSCLPLLIQLPVLLVLYRVFLSGVHADHLNLLYSFVPAPTAIDTTLFGVDLQHPNLYFGLVAGGLQFIQTWQLMQRQQQKQDQRKLPRDEKPPLKADAAKSAETLTSRMTYAMPLLTVFIALSLPSALAIYWSVTTVFGILQQWYLINTQPALPHQHVEVSVRRVNSER